MSAIPSLYAFIVDDVMHVLETGNSHFCDHPSSIQFRSVHVLNRITPNHSYITVTYTGAPVLQLTEGTIVMVVYVLPSRYLVFQASLSVSGPRAKPVEVDSLSQCIACVRLPVWSIAHAPNKDGIGLVRKLDDTRHNQSPTPSTHQIVEFLLTTDLLQSQPTKHYKVCRKRAFKANSLSRILHVMRQNDRVSRPDCATV